MVHLFPRTLALAALLMTPIAGRANGHAELRNLVRMGWKVYQYPTDSDPTARIMRFEYPVEDQRPCRFSGPEGEEPFQETWRLEDPLGVALCSLVVARDAGQEAPVTLTVVPDPGCKEWVDEVVTQVNPQRVVVHGYCYMKPDEPQAPKAKSRRLAPSTGRPQFEALPPAAADGLARVETKEAKEPAER